MSGLWSLNLTKYDLRARKAGFRECSEMLAHPLPGYSGFLFTPSFCFCQLTFNSLQTIAPAADLITAQIESSLKPLLLLPFSFFFFFCELFISFCDQLITSADAVHTLGGKRVVTGD